MENYRVEVPIWVEEPESISWPHLIGISTFEGGSNAAATTKIDTTSTRCGRSLYGLPTLNTGQ